MASDPTASLGSGREFGIFDTQALAKEYPAVTTSLAMATAREAGLDPSDPKNIVRAMQSRTFQGRIDKTRKDREGKFIQRLIGGSNQNPLPGKDAPAAQQIEGLATYQEGTIQDRMKARGILGAQTAEAEAKYAEFADLDRESYKRGKLSELNPTASIDNQIMALRTQEIVAKTQLREKYKGLRPSIRAAVIDAHMQVFRDSKSTLTELRNARLEAAKEQADREFDSKMEQGKTAQSRVNALKKMMELIETTGEDAEALAGIRMDYLKESKKLEKTGGAGGVTDEVNLIKSAILNQFAIDNPGDVPTADIIKEAERRAKVIVQQRKDAKTRAGKQPAAVTGVDVARGLSEPGGLYTDSPTGGLPPLLRFGS